MIIHGKNFKSRGKASSQVHGLRLHSFYLRRRALGCRFLSVLLAGHCNAPALHCLFSSWWPVSCGSQCIRIVGLLIGGLDQGEGLAGIQSQAVHRERKQLSICGVVTLFLQSNCKLRLP